MSPHHIDNWASQYRLLEGTVVETYKVHTHEFNSPGITVKGSLRVRFAGGPPPLAEEKPIRQ